MARLFNHFCRNLEAKFKAFPSEVEITKKVVQAVLSAQQLVLLDVLKLTN